MLFMPQDPEAAAAAAVIVEKVVAAEGRCRIAGWRDVPSDNSVVGRMAKAEQPIIRQVSFCALYSCVQQATKVLLGLVGPRFILSLAGGFLCMVVICSKDVLQYGGMRSGHATCSAHPALFLLTCTKHA